MSWVKYARSASYRRCAAPMMTGFLLDLLITALVISIAPVPANSLKSAWTRRANMPPTSRNSDGARLGYRRSRTSHRSPGIEVSGLDQLAVRLDRFLPALDADLEAVQAGGSAFKAVRGEYGAGKTFFSRYLAERALRRGFAAAEVQISETQTPLHRLETVYRRVTESLRTASYPPSAFRPVLDSWLFTLESDAVATDPALAGADHAAVRSEERRVGKEC